mmetsp:Transcript_33870/g.58532  ORF Transcript_33870/g.58532 Transcript_33870/m.58532 type:complete len:212 (-) Transcript_33870:275-910(-)
MEVQSNPNEHHHEAVLKLQALFRGKRSRDIHTSRVRKGLLTSPYYITPLSVIERMIVGASIGPKDLVIDLGCGKGSILIESARCAGAQCIGFDIDMVLLREAKRQRNDHGTESRVDLVAQDIFKVNLKLATVLLIFLVPSMLHELAPRLQEQLQPGSRIVSYHFPIPGMEPCRIEEGLQDPLKENSTTSLYFYTILSDPSVVSGASCGGPI